MADLAVYIPCDHRDCYARSRDIWAKNAGEFLLSFCGHHGDSLWAKLSARGFMPVEHDAAHDDDCDSEVVK